MDFKEVTKKLLNEIREKETKNKCMNINMNKRMNDEQENTNKRLIEIMKTIQDLRVKFNQEIETLKRTSQNENRVE